jgi:hypothetical protein
MGRTPMATAYQTPFAVEDPAEYKTEPTPIRRQTTWNTTTNPNSKTKKRKETIHIAGKPTMRTAGKQPKKGSKRTHEGQQETHKRGGRTHEGQQKNPQRGMGAR